MRIESEKLLESKLRKGVEDKGGYCIKIPAIHLSGIPDRVLFLSGGRTVFVELKTTKQKPRKIQLIWHNRLRKLGFQVEIIDTSLQITELLKSI